jgi:hypothetical protein
VRYFHGTCIQEITFTTSAYTSTIHFIIWQNLFHFSYKPCFILCLLCPYSHLYISFVWSLHPSMVSIMLLNEHLHLWCFHKHSVVTQVQQVAAPYIQKYNAYIKQGTFLRFWNLQYEFCCNNHHKTGGLDFHFDDCAWMFLRENGLYKHINISYNLSYIYLKREKSRLTLNSALTTALKWYCNKLFINLFKNLLLISSGGYLSKVQLISLNQ